MACHLARHLLTCVIVRREDSQTFEVHLLRILGVHIDPGIWLNLSYKGKGTHAMTLVYLAVSAHSSKCRRLGIATR